MKLFTFKNTVIGSVLGSFLLFGAIGSANAQNYNDEYRQWQEAQRRAQAELDALAETGLSMASMAGATPYVDAILLETLRWHPPAPLGRYSCSGVEMRGTDRRRNGGFPHVLSQDDTYNGYFIPPGTAVLVNVWCAPHPSVPDFGFHL